MAKGDEIADQRDVVHTVWRRRCAQMRVLGDRRDGLTTFRVCGMQRRSGQLQRGVSKRRTYVPAALSLVEKGMSGEGNECDHRPRTLMLPLVVDASRELESGKVLHGIEEGDGGDEELPLGQPTNALGQDWRWSQE